MTTLQLRVVLILLSAWVLSVSDRAQAQEESYPTPPEAQRADDVPEGKIEGPFTFQSKIFAGTERKYWLYIPQQYDADKPACSLIVQDGLNRAKGWRLPEICDTLIHNGEMPVTIGIFISPGEVPVLAEGSQEAQPRFNRSFEYDSLGDRYARFLLEEIIPEVSQKYNLSPKPNDRAIAGASSGGICAFNAAWERPDAFRRVLSTIGTYVGLRGGNELSALVRKTEPKAIRVFMQDGSSDLNIYAGDWWMANQDMYSALEWAGYDVKHVWGEGGHNGKHAAAIMPDALRWLWRDYPEPIVAPSASNDKRRVDVLIDGEAWAEVSSGHEYALAPTANSQGEVFFSDSKTARIYRVGPDAKTRLFADQTGPIDALCFQPQDELLGIRDGKEIVRFDAEGKPTVLIPEVSANQLLSLPDGFYYADPAKPALFFSNYQGEAKEKLTLQQPVQGLVTTADHAFLHLLGSGQFTQHARVGPQRNVDSLQNYGYLELPYANGNSGAAGIVVDEGGRSYVATTVGIQVLDQLGRVNFIISLPTNSAPTGIAFGGANRNYLFVTTAEGVYRRRLNTLGALPQLAPAKPPKPRL